MRGWLFDIYPDYRSNSIVYWVRTRRGAHRVVDRSFRPKIYVRSTPENLADLEKALPMLDSVGALEREMKRTWLGEDARELLAVTVKEYGKVEELAHTIDSRGRYREYELYNVDLRFSQRYLIEKNLFPMGLLELRPGPHMLEDPYALHFELPPLTAVELALEVRAGRGVPTFDDRLISAKVGEHVLDGDEESVLRGIEECLAEEDPDVVFTEDGDAFALPYLYARAERLGLPSLRLGRDEDGLRADRMGRSYFTYGRIRYKPPSYKLRGRIHIDRSSSFMFMESGLVGLTDLSRMSCIPLQELARLSPGSAISAMEVNQALRDGCVVMWKKNLPECFKTAEELVLADRGGFIYEPVVGIHDRVLEVDFTSLYPNIMVRFNISPETIMCRCCQEPARRVPVLGYGICDRRVGLIPRVLRPVVERRTRLKRMLRAGVGDPKAVKERVDILKWLLVTCLDEGTELPFVLDGRFDARPVEELVRRSSGGKCGRWQAPPGLAVFGVDPWLRPAVKDVSAVFEFEAPQRMVELDLGDSELRLTPDHPCYVLRAGRLEVTSAARVRAGDAFPRLLPLRSEESGNHVHVGAVRVRARRWAAPAGDRVYCLGVSEPPHAFALANGVLTHNCFGYTGYRNARFGRIECHEAINAFAREIMLQASEMAEAYGFEILHGIVDSLWLKGDGDPERFCEHVSGHIGIPLEPEGIYRWIVFLPAKTRGVGALNRYYGLFEDGRVKVRGIDLRRSDSPGIVKDLQSDLLEHFSQASNSKEFMELLPSSLDIVGEYVEALRSGTVPLDKLLMTRRVSQGLDEYRQFNDSAAALAQLDDEGFGLNPGEAVRYLICDRGSRDPWKRVRVESFIAGDEEYDIDAYVELVLRGAEGMLLPFGYDLERLSGLFRAKGMGRNRSRK